MIQLNFNSNRGKTGWGGRIAGVLFGLVFMTMGLIFAGFIVRDVVRTLDTWRWREVECKIVESRVDRDDDRFYVKLTYTYTVDGQTHRSGAWRLDDSGFEHVDEAERVQRRYPVGSTSTCLVHPDEAGRAVMQRGNPAKVLLVLFPLVFVVVGFFVARASWRSGRDRDESISSGAVSTSGSSVKGRLLMVGFFSVFLAFGLGFLYVITIRPALRIAAARDWVEVPCEVLESEVRSHQDDDGTTYSVYILYRYVWQDELYRSDRYSFFTGSSSGHAGKARVVEQYPPGHKTTCFVNPDDPHDAVLHRGATSSMWLGLFPLVFVAVGVGGITWVLKRKFDAPAVPAAVDGSASGSTGTTHSATHPVPGGPVTLKPSASPVLKLVGSILAAVFWNGIVSVFLVQVVQEWQQGGAPWFLTLFMVPFVLVGLGLIVAVFYNAVALLNPRITVVTDGTRVCLGQEVGIKWSIGHGASRLRRLTITFEGKERATYRRGTDTRTDEETFAVVPVTEQTDAAQIAEGGAIFCVPPTTMHTFAASNNKITWQLVVAGDIPRRPDISERYDIEVLPYPVATEDPS